MRSSAILTPMSSESHFIFWLFNHSGYESLRVTTNMNIFLTLILPLMVAGAAGSYRGSLMEVHHGFLAVWSGR
jgi:hypothetical protein